MTDHKALVSLLNGNNKKNKTMFSRLTRWIDRIIPFDFLIEHMPGAKIGLADREAITVLLNLTKNPSSQNLNWDRVLKQKSACFDSTDPRASKFPQPMATDWEERSDIDYDMEHINYPRKLVQEQLVSVADRTSTPAGGLKHAVGVKSRDANAQTSNRPNKRTELLFQRTKDTNKRYRPVKQKVVDESQHTIT